MTITDVKIRRLIDNGTPMKAIVSITIDEQFAIHDLKVIEVDKGKHFIAMPSTRDNRGEFRDICHPIGKDARDKLTSTILSAYFRAKEKAPQATGNSLESKDK